MIVAPDSKPFLFGKREKMLPLFCRLLKAYPAVLKNLSINLQLLPEEPLIGDEGART